MDASYVPSGRRKQFESAVKRLPRRLGLTLIELLVSLAIVLMLAAVMLPAIAQSRAAAHRLACVNNLKQIGIALHLRHDSYGSFPAGRGVPAPKIFSPQAAILPYVENANAHNLIDFSLPPADYTAGAVAYDGSRNLAVACLTLPVFRCPAAGDDGRVAGSVYGGTNYAACAGSGRDAGTLKDSDGLFYLGSAIRVADITDGTSMTAAFSERPLGEGNTRRSSEAGNPQMTMREIPASSDPLPHQCTGTSIGSWNHERGAKWIVGNYGNTLYNHELTPNSQAWDCLNLTQQKGRMAARSRHPGGVNLLFCDGHVQFVSNAIARSAWQAFATRADGEVEPN